MSAEHYRVLFQYNAWANQRVLTQAAQVPEAEYFAKAPGLSFGESTGEVERCHINGMVPKAAPSATAL